MLDAALVMPEVTRLIRDCVRNPDIAMLADTTLASISGMDSLRLLETLAMAERRFGVEIQLHDLDRFATVDDIVAAIVEAPAAASPF